jgi:cytochrome c-type biogenesis protein
MSQPGLLAAALAGLLSFLSPCVLPLIPAYLSFISGASITELTAKKSKSRIFLRSLTFSAGFTLAFTILGIVFSGGAMFAGQAGVSGFVNVAGGVLVALLGINLIFNFLRFLDSDTRLIQKLSQKKAKSTGPRMDFPSKTASGAGSGSAFVLGLAFAAGWSPCIGPILASILLYAGREGNAAKSAALLLAYSLGFALPFLATGLFFDRLKPLLSFFKRKGNEVRIISGIVLVLFGLAMAFGSLGYLSSIASRSGASLTEFVKSHSGLSHAIALAVFLILALPALFGIARMRSRSPKPISKNHPQLAEKLSQTTADVGKTMRSGIGLKAYLATLLLLAILELTGAISLLGFLAGWLGYSGL